ncbi:transcription factor bHLH155-like isoform X2 [Phragmites australis]|uniref:transcription factor bHLH155-like isoform X2 n=1 Tax=Phragmites australis TaxID=29695 RepID=UPI002D786CF1|nr:transcription factor bHLH155-like isoform X2 [Phragmites australis]
MGMSTHLTPLLQGLCSDGLWKYAVFWSFKSETSGILTWGDSYVNKAIKDSQMGDLCAGSIVSKNQIILSSCCNNGQYQIYPFCRIERALLRMSSNSYPLGEEIIGKVALTGQHCWISANELCSTSLYKHHHDWHLQFAAGIKSVLLVPVIPHGVLQLGSLDMVFESSALVALIKDLFHELYDTSIYHNSLATGSGYSNTLKQPIADPPDVHDFIDAIESSAQFLTVDHLNLPHPFTMPEFPVSEDVTTGAYRTGLTGRPNGPWEYESIDGFNLTDMTREYQEHTHGSTIVQNDDVLVSNSSIHSEFDQDLEGVFIQSGRLKRQQEHTGHALLQVNGNNNADPYLQLETNSYAELLPDTIVDQICHNANGESPGPTDSPDSCEIQIKKENHALRQHELSVNLLPGGQELSPISMNEGFMGSAMTDKLPTEINKTISEECRGRTVEEYTHMINSAEIKRRCRKIEHQRQRPRDRQLIQDRMEELRELIPNASKCSIDALLDKTIMYMLFLQSVSERAEKIENALEEEESSDESKKQLERCPLRVEELDQPGHLLIEGLEVSMLKGVLERRSDDNHWARFVIEASSQGFNQMQILCPLMHLLHRRR